MNDNRNGKGKRNENGKTIAEVLIKYENRKTWKKIKINDESELGKESNWSETIWRTFCGSIKETYVKCQEQIPEKMPKQITE